MAEQVKQMYNCKQVGISNTVKETYYAISPERKLKHPGAIKITEGARSNLLI